ncbi:MAG TPA: hypothetical protein VGD71_30790 [Kribbella sp.]
MSDQLLVEAHQFLDWATARGAWINNCVGDPEADNLIFKYAGALRDFGELERARNVYLWLQG